MAGQSAHQSDAARAIRDGEAVLGIELGSTRIKSCLILADGEPVATGSHQWDNSLVDGHWSYSLTDIWSGLRASVADLLAQTEAAHGVRPTSFAAMGVSAMMHGYMAFDGQGELLVPFRTWQDTCTGPAAAELTQLFGQNIPLRWPVAHLRQAVLDGEEHVSRVAALNTLAGYVHWKLTGQRVLGIGDAVGMFPVDEDTGQYDARMLAEYEALASQSDLHPLRTLEELLPRILMAGEDAGRLTEEGAALLDPTGDLEPGVPFCPPEGDAGTGMVATNSVRPRTGNVSVGTSIFAMVVLEKKLPGIHEEIDLVTTPAGHPVAMVHCNNGTSELSEWMGLFSQVAMSFGSRRAVTMDDVYRVLLSEIGHGDADAGGLLACNYRSGEPITGLTEGRPLLVRGPESRLSVANFLRSQLYSSFATLALGMEVLAAEGVGVDMLFAHGGLFRTAGVPQQLLAGAMGSPVGVAESASEGGAWGIALLANYLAYAGEESLEDYLRQRIFRDRELNVIQPDPRDSAGFAAYLERYRAVIDLERLAVDALPSDVGRTDNEDGDTDNE